MNEKEFQQKLGDLISQIQELPEDQRGTLSQLAAETQTRHDKMKKTITDLQDSLDYLRLSIKYLVFDLEATRRENTYLRKLIDQQNGKAGGEDQPEQDN